MINIITIKTLIVINISIITIIILRNNIIDRINNLEMNWERDRKARIIIKRIDISNMITKEYSIHQKIITHLGNIKVNKNIISLNIKEIISMSSLHSENKAM